MLDKKTVIFDLDGTIADVKKRRLSLQGESRDWDAFHAGIKDDPPNTPVVELYRVLWDSARYEIIIVTGRMEQYRLSTGEWLTRHEIPFQTLKMRADGDFRADHIIKEEMLLQLLGEGKEPVFVVDDRQQVVDMCRRHGITCLQCDKGDF